MSAAELIGWERLRHGGLLLDPPRLRQVAAASEPPRLQSFYQEELRRRLTSPPESSSDIGDLVAFVLQKVCRFSNEGEAWLRGSSVGADWSRPTVTGEAAKPRHLWHGRNGAILPVFIDNEGRIGVGRGRKVVSQAIQWLRAGTERLALVTNGRQFRLLFAGLDFDAWCEWDTDLWLDEGSLSSQVSALRTLLSPELWTPPAKGEHSPLVAAILESRKGQAELSAVLGERVREAVELLVQAHGTVLQSGIGALNPADIYRAAVRVVMRMVVVLFAESRESLLPTANPLYNSTYGLTGLLSDLEKVAARGGSRLGRSYSAWPRVLALFRLVHAGSHHPELAVPAYGGELFAPGDPAASEGLSRALAIFERAAFEHEVLSDRDVHHLLDKITRTRVRVRQGKSATWIPAPVDFSDLSTEYIGILYEGLLDFELKTAPAGEPVVFLAVGNQPALPLSRLEAMDDKGLTGLLEKMKDTSGPDTGGEEGEEAAAGEEADDELDDGAEQADGDEAGEVPADAFDDDQGPEDPRHATRTRAEKWARRAVEVGKLVRRPAGALTPEKRNRYDEEVGRKARQLVARVMLPGEWYLVRWGGTRKGAGTFYTRPGLAVPTVHRTLRPLAYDPPEREDGTPDRDAPASGWTPKPPEQILALKVCDPACGSGTFPVAALRYLTDALYASLHHHGRFGDAGDRTMVQLLASASASPNEAGAQAFGQELLPCRPDDLQFEPRLKAVLRRYIVERCIYGVDLDPLAVELCRLALWIETMDRQLPFSFLDHKVKCGNSLVGAWFDQFQHYPVMAWKNREAGDKNHANGVHYKKEVRTKAIKSFVKDRLTPDLRQFLAGRTLLSEDLQQKAGSVHDEALAVLARVHGLPMQDSAERARIYRDQVLGSPAYRSLKSAMDLWCACWFWPADDLADSPLPSTLAAPSAETGAVAARIADSKRFFHWELEFPDVFSSIGSGFDAVLGNPPWDIAKPSSKEFFSNIDPLYRSYGKQEALRYQSEYFARETTERDWLDYAADFKAQSNFMGYASSPFGDPADGGSGTDRFTFGGGQQTLLLHERWRGARHGSRGYADAAHPFRHQGSADINLYKAFLEQAHALIRPSGRLGFIVPSGLYSDHGTRDLRRLFLDRCQWEWLFGFENRDRIFEIHRSYKFNPVIVEKGGSTNAIRTAFMRRRLEDWEQAEAFVTPYSRAQVEQFSPRAHALTEVTDRADLDVLERLYAQRSLISELGGLAWVQFYGREFHTTGDSSLFPPRDHWERQGFVPDLYGRWLFIEETASPTSQEDDARLPVRDGRAVAPSQVERVALPMYEGRLFAAFDFAAKRYLYGSGSQAKWEPVPWDRKEVVPHFLIGQDDALAFSRYRQGPKVAYRNITRSTDRRSFIGTVLVDAPTPHVTYNLVTTREAHTWGACVVLNSFVLDWIIRRRLGGTHLDEYLMRELPIPPAAYPALDLLGLRLAGCHERFAAAWTAWEREDEGSLRVRAPWRSLWALSEAERVRLRSIADAIVAALFALSGSDLARILADSDLASSQLDDPHVSKGVNPVGFWRVDKEKDPELRHTVLTLVAFHDLEAKVQNCGGDCDKGIEAFLSQNDGEGWMLPETLRLADFGLGHDDRAKVHQPVASRLGPRFFDWQLTQSADESWRECHVHARNLLDEASYSRLLAPRSEGIQTADTSRAESDPRPPVSRGGKLFD